MLLDDVKISCLVCTQDGPASLDELIDSLAVQGWVGGDELIVIDNGMTPERRAQVEERIAPFAEAGIGAQLITEIHPGLVHARLKAIESSTNPWLLLLDDNNLLDAEGLRQIRRRLAKHPALGGICPRVEPAWETKPKPWVVALGHQVLGYNTSEMHERPSAWHLWEPGIIGQRPPGGGMIIARSVAVEFLQLCQEAPIILTFAPNEGRRMAGNDFILYSLIYRSKELVTAYDDSIIVRRQVAPALTTFGSLVSAMFWNNYSHGVIGLMRFGKGRFIDVTVRGLSRLVFEFFQQTKRVTSLRILLGYMAGAVGFVYGVLAGLVSSNCVRIQVDP